MKPSPILLYPLGVMDQGPFAWSVHPFPSRRCTVIYVCTLFQAHINGHFQLRFENVAHHIIEHSNSICSTVPHSSSYHNYSSSKSKSMRNCMSYQVEGPLIAHPIGRQHQLKVSSIQVYLLQLATLRTHLRRLNS